MAPSPMVSKSEVPETPTRAGRNPESSSTSKLTPKEQKGPATTPRKPPKLGPPKSASRKQAEHQRNLSQKSEDVKERTESSGGELSSEPYQKIAMKENDHSAGVGEGDRHDDSTSVADTSELEEAQPEPMDDDNEEGNDTNTGARGRTDVAREEGTETEDAAEEADNESDKGTVEKSKSGANGVVGGASKAKDTASDATEAARDQTTNLATETKDLASDVTDSAKDQIDNTTRQGKDTANDVSEAAKEQTKKLTSEGKDTVEDAADTAWDQTENTAIKAEDAAEAATETTEDLAESAANKSQGAEEDMTDGAASDTSNAPDLAQESKEGIQDAAQTGEQAAADTKDPTSNALQREQDTGEEIGDNAQEISQDVDEKAKETTQGVEDAAQDSEDVKADTEKQDEATRASDDAKRLAGEAGDEAEDKVDSGTEDVTGDLPDKADDADDLASLKGLKVQENGEIHDDAGNVIGKLEEGDPTDLEGYEIGDDGEILDEDGDVVGRATLFSPKDREDAENAGDAVGGSRDQVEDASGQAANTYLPDLDVLKGLEVQENGDIQNKDGTVLGHIVEGDPADLVGMTLNEEGEILDEDGDVVGRAETLPQEVEDEERHVPGLDALEGLAVDEDGAIKDAQGNTLGKITEGDPDDLVGRKLNADGEVLDEDGDVIGRAQTVPQATQAVEQSGKHQSEELSPEVARVQDLEEQLKPNLDIVEGRKLNKKGNILDDEGDILAQLVDGDAKACAGRLPNENGEILDDDGNVIGRVEVVSGEAAEEAMKAAHPALVDELEEARKAAEEAEQAESGAQDAQKEAEDAADEAKQAADEATTNFGQLEGLKVNKKGEVFNEDGGAIARLADGELDEVRGKKINDKGQIVDQDGNVLGRVEFIPEAIDQGLVEVAEEAAKESSTSFLEGYKVNKNGEVINEDGDVVAKLSEGNLDHVKGKTLNAKGEIVDDDGNVLGKVEPVSKGDDEQVDEGEAEQVDDGSPPLSVLKGLGVNKSGKLVDSQGNIVGELVEGDPKKLWKTGAKSDEDGQFWDNQGHVIGRAKTIPTEEETEGEFAGLDGLVVVKDGWIEDENSNRVGKIVDGDAKKLIGRAVDEDGDIIDKRGNVVGHAERYEELEEEEAPHVDLSELKGLTPNKQGNVIGRDGVPIGRLVEGNPKELAGRKIDENGQIWNDEGKVVGHCELIPAGEREAKPEGPFAGLSGLVVVQNGYVQDEDGNTVGVITEGDAKKLVGRGVDEDGDIIDKYGNVKGHAELYEAPEEEPEASEDLSSLAGKTINKQGKAVDEHGTIFGQVVEGDIKRLAGCKVDGQGQIWSNDGKVIGKAGLIAGGDDGRSEGPFSNFESTTVGKDGMVKDSSGEIIGRVIEGNAKKLVGRHVDDDGDILDKNGNVIGKAERWEPEEKQREVNPMAGLRVNKEGEVRDKNGDVIGRLTDGNLLHCIGREINDNGYVVDQDGNKLGEVTLLENIQEEEEVEEGPTDEEAKKEEERQIANKIGNILNQTIEKMEPICKQIDEAVEKADRTPREELDEEELVNKVKPLIEEGGRILSECNGSIRGLDPDGHIAAQAKARHASGEATPEEHRVAEGLKELTGNIVKCIDNAKKKIADMPHAKKKLSPLWALLTEPLFQIIAAVGLLLSGVLGLVGKLLNGLGLGGLVNGILGGLGINKLLDGVGLGSITESLGFGGGKKKK